MTDLKKMTLRELKAFARTNKIKGYSKYKKTDLLNFLSNFSNPSAISESQMKVGGSVLENQSRKKQTRREERDKKNFVYSFNEDLPQVNQDKRLKHLKKSLAAVNKKLKKNKKERNKNISRWNNINKEIEKLKFIPQKPIPAPRTKLLPH